MGTRTKVMYSEFPDYRLDTLPYIPKENLPVAKCAPTFGSEIGVASNLD